MYRFLSWLTKLGLDFNTMDHQTAVGYMEQFMFDVDTTFMGIDRITFGSMVLNGYIEVRYAQLIEALKRREQ